MTHPPFDAGIPVLTEIIPAPPAASPQEEQESFAPPSEPVEIVPEAPAPIAWSEGQWERMESEIRERVLQQVLKRIDLALEDRVRDSLADVLQLAVDGLTEQIRGGLQQTVRDLVTRAVSEEIKETRAFEK